MLSLLALQLLLASPAAESKGIYGLPPAAFAEQARADLVSLRQYVDGMRGVMERVRARPALFGARANSVYSPEDKRALLSTWGSLYAYFSAAEGLRQRYWDFVRLPPTDARHAWGFLVTHTALTALLAHGLEFSQLALNDKQLETLFDEANTEFGVPRGAFKAFKLKAIHVATSTQLVTGEQYERVAVPLLRRHPGAAAEPVPWAIETMRTEQQRAKEALVRHGGRLYAGNAKDLLEDGSARALFPAQKSIAAWMGNTRVARQGRSLVSAEDVARRVLPQLEPGDVIVTRMNWFLSNVGLPGFWPHAELYVGTAGDLARAFDADPEVAAWVKAQPEGATGFTALLARRYPQKWETYARGKDFQGHGPIRVIESISEGVSFTAVEHAFGVDYLGAMRPRLSKVDKARAIERAFRYQGRPYDFDFDFFSDATLVCTELVFKAYQPGDGARGLSLDLVDVAGRRTLPANEIVHRFDQDRERGTPQFDFVLFLDGREKEGRAVTAGEAEFRASWSRIKWDVAQR